LAGLSRAEDWLVFAEKSEEQQTLEAAAVKAAHWNEDDLTEGVGQVPAPSIVRISRASRDHRKLA